jgi:hypothetical protein
MLKKTYIKMKSLTFHINKKSITLSLIKTLNYKRLKDTHSSLASTRRTHRTCKTPISHQKPNCSLSHSLSHTHTHIYIYIYIYIYYCMNSREIEGWNWPLEIDASHGHGVGKEEKSESPTKKKKIRLSAFWGKKPLNPREKSRSDLLGTGSGMGESWKTRNAAKS